MTKTNPDKAEYTRGYRAGRRRTEEEMEESRRAFDQAAGLLSQFRREAFCAALTGLLAGNGGWKIGGKSVDNSSAYVELAAKFADDAVKKMGRGF